MAKWYFGKLGPNDKRRNPMQGEFFRNDDPGSEARMLVREGIQNSLDAKAEDNHGPVRIRIHASGKRQAARWRDIGWIFEDAWPHYEAPRNGLVKQYRPDENSRDQCPFLVFEDFGTTGLIGDVRQIAEPDVGEDNPFYYFMRAEGESGKSGSARGRWGLGKFVFPKASLVRSFLAVTRREGELHNLLTGQYVLKCHQIGDVQYSPDGWFGDKDDRGVYIPSDDQRAIARVEKIFGLQRGDKPGLSLIIPWCQDQIDAQTLVVAVIRDFYFPILRGQLVVEVFGPEVRYSLDSDNFAELFEEYRTDLDVDARSIDLAERAVSSLGNVRFKMERKGSGRPSFDALEVSEGQLEEMREADSGGELLSIRVPVQVEPADKRLTPEISYFDIWMQRDQELSAGRPTFIREGLIIPEAGTRRIRTHQAVVLIEDTPLARLLGDSENPSHTNWSFQSENFVGKYRFGKEVISLVKRSVAEIVELIRGAEDERDAESLADLFRLPNPDRRGRDPGRGGGEGKREHPQPPVGTNNKYWSFHKINSGIVISAGDKEFQQPVELEMKFAYDRQKGSPASNWKPADFELNRDPISIEASGTDLVEDLAVHDNVVKATVKGPDFKVSIRGFDGKRDLWFDVKEREV